MSTSAAAPGRSFPLVSGALALFLLALLGVQAPHLLDPGVILDNARQYGPPMVAALQGNGNLASQPQIHYFAAASPRLWRWLVEAVAGGAGLSVVATTKLLAVALLLPLAAVARGLGRALFPSPPRAALFAVLLLANAIFANQMLTGTSRDGGTLLTFALLLFLLRRQPLGVLLCLPPLAGLYPTFALLALATLWLVALLPLLLPGRAACPFGSRRRTLLVLALSLPAAALGVKLLGPQISHTDWGPTFRLFQQQPFAALQPLARSVKGHGPSVVSLLGFQPTPAALLELLGDKRFRPLPPSGQHAFGWIGDPASILAAGGILALLRLATARPRGARAALLTCWRESARHQAWPLQVLAALLLAGILLYGLSFALAFLLHNPNRYTMVPAVVLLSLVELAVLGWLAALVARYSPSGVRGAGLVVLALALLLALLRPPVDAMRVPAGVIGAVARGLDPATARVLVVEAGSGSTALGDLASALPLVGGVRVFYAEEMDRGFHRRAIRDGLELRRDQQAIERLVEGSDPGLDGALRRAGLTHLLGPAGLLEPLARQRGLDTGGRCLVPIAVEEGSPLLLLDARCRGAGA